MNNNIQSAITEIGPLNNKYRDYIASNTPAYLVLELMWEIGCILENYINLTQLKPHALFWEIYGKADGTKKSYITRDLMSYCYRIKKLFKDKSEIKEKFYYLKRYSLFREAMPFIENGKYKLDIEEKNNLIKIMNSNNSIIEIKKYILNIKNIRINKKNPRNQKDYQVVEFKKIFYSFKHYTEELLKNEDNKSMDIINNIGKNNITATSQLVSSLVREKLFIPILEVNNIKDTQFQRIVSEIYSLHKKQVEDRNRVRKLIPIKDIFTVAENVTKLNLL